ENRCCRYLISIIQTQSYRLGLLQGVIVSTSNGLPSIVMMDLLITVDSSPMGKLYFQMDRMAIFLLYLSNISSRSYKRKHFTQRYQIRQVRICVIMSCTMHYTIFIDMVA